MLIARGTPEPKEVEFKYPGDQPRAAARHFRQQFGFWPDEVFAADIPEESLVFQNSAWTVVGGCESCGEAILEGDEYVYTHDSVHLCGACGKALVAEEGTEA